MSQTEIIYDIENIEVIEKEILVSERIMLANEKGFDCGEEVEFARGLRQIGVDIIPELKKKNLGKEVQVYYSFAPGIMGAVNFGIIVGVVKIKIVFIFFDRFSMPSNYGRAGQYTERSIRDGKITLWSIENYESH